MCEKKNSIFAASCVESAADYEGISAIELPDINKGRAGLDSGQGFYVTDLLQQAESWADRMLRIRLKTGVEGGVANDCVIDIVEAYMSDMMPLETDLRNLSMHRPNNQLCIRNQQVVDRFFTFVESYKI